MRLAGAIAAGLLYGLALREPDLRLLAWCSLVPLLVALRGAGPWSAAALAGLWTFVMSLVGGSWFPGGMIRYFDRGLAAALGIHAVPNLPTGRSGMHRDIPGSSP